MKTLTAFIVLLIFCMAIVAFNWIILKKIGKDVLRKDREQELRHYENQYGSILADIESYPNVPGNRESLLKELAVLEKLPHKNREMTEVLRTQILMKFPKVTKKTVTV